MRQLQPLVGGRHYIGLREGAGVAADSRRDGGRSTLLWDVLRGVLSAAAETTGRPELDIVDVGGGTGGLAVPFAALGHHVTVVDPSPDALAAALRRAAEVGAHLVAVQGEAASLDSVADPGSADLVICHNVLEYVDSPADAMAAIARVLRPSATVSVLAANSVAAVLHRALAGRFAEARLLLADGTTNGTGTPGTTGTGTTNRTGTIGTTGGTGTTGTTGAADGTGDQSGLPRRFTLSGLTALIEGAGLRPGQVHGLRIFGGLVPGALLDGDAGAAEALRALEEAAASTPPLRDIAAQLHVLGHR
jgi:S-adenosylmethionine-dependent methyltransferase